MSDDEQYLGRTFKSGNSVALRLPKGLGLPEGTEVRMVREGRMTFRVEPVDRPKGRFDIDSIWGLAPDLEPVKPEERAFEPSKRPWDDPEWQGWPEARG